jgi:hypothetical protein
MSIMRRAGLKPCGGFAIDPGKPRDEMNKTTRKVSELNIVNGGMLGLFSILRVKPAVTVSHTDITR